MPKLLACSVKYEEFCIVSDERCCIFACDVNIEKNVAWVLRKNLLKNDPLWQQESKSPPGVSQS